MKLKNIYKLLFAVTSLMMFSNIVFGQETRIGITGGILSSTLKNQSSKAGYSFGVMVEVPLCETIMFNTGLNLALKGGKSSYYYGNNEKSEKITNNTCMELPVYFSYKFDLNKKDVSILPYVGVFGEAIPNREIYSKGDDVTTDLNDLDLPLFDGGIKFGGSLDITNSIRVSVERNICFFSSKAKDCHNKDYRILLTFFF